MQKDQPSPALHVIMGELRRQGKLTAAVLVVSFLDSVLVFGVSSYVVSVFAEKVAQGEATSNVLHSLVRMVVGIVLGHSLLFFLRVRWRRALTERGREALSDRLDAALAKG